MEGPTRSALAWARARAPEAAAALVGVGWFLAVGGWRTVSVTSLEWARGDQVQHVLGWLFFRRSAWGLPLGRIDGLAWPVGTTVGYTDANPLLAIPAKLLSPVLPERFQYIGLWLCLCYGLQGWFGARLAGLASSRAAWRLLCGVLFALSPVLLARRSHDTLCAHGALLALLYLNLRGDADPRSARRGIIGAAALSLALAAVHPYLAFMALALSASLLARLALCDRAIPRRRAIRAFLTILVGQIALLGIQGYFTSAPSHAPGFGRFTADLLAFVNPFGASSLLPDLPVIPEEWEGNAYLGAGGILVVLAGLALAIASRGRSTAPGDGRCRWPICAVTAGMALFAVSPVVHAAGREVVSWHRVARALQPIAGAIHSSGRFIWPLYYLLLAAALAGIARGLRRWPAVATSVVALAVALQLADLGPRAVGAHFRPSRWMLRAPEWALARGRYDLVALYPPLVVGVWSRCRGLEWGDDEAWVPLAEMAYEQRMAINSAQLARGFGKRLEVGCDALARAVESGRFPTRTVFVVHPSKLASFQGRPGAACGRVEGYHVCVASAQDDAFRRALAREY